MNYLLTINTYENNNLLFKNITKGYLEDNYLTYSTDTDNIKINLHTFSFTKDNHESTFKITKNTCYLYIKELNQTLNIPINYFLYS